jgi:rod shape-determining protein MreC
VREFFNSWRFRIIALVVLVIIGIMLRAATSAGNASFPASVVSVIVTPIQRISSQISDAASNLLASFTTYSAVKEENDQLKKQLQVITGKLVDYDELQRQNVQYKEYLGIKDANPDFKFATAMVISRDPGQWFSSFTIDKGSIDGIMPKDPVITADGLVGIVAQVMPTSCVVTTILDPTTQVGAIISHTGDICISQGSRELAAKGQLKIIFIPRNSTVSKGDIVITSGFGGIFPKGLKIGTVEDIKLDISGMSLYAVTQPMVNISEVKYVSIITDFRGKASDFTSSQGGASK